MGRGEGKALVSCIYMCFSFLDLRLQQGCCYFEGGAHVAVVAVSTAESVAEIPSNSLSSHVTLLIEMCMCR